MKKILFNSLLIITGLLYSYHSSAAITRGWNGGTINGGGSGPEFKFCADLAFHAIPDIIFTEGANNDFGVGTDSTLILSIPAGYSFEPGAGSVTISGADITSADIFVSSTKIYIVFTVAGVASSDVMTISGVRIKKNTLGNVTTAVDITRSAGNASVAGLGTSGGTSVVGIINADGGPASVDLNIGAGNTSVCINAPTFSLGTSLTPVAGTACTGPLPYAADCYTLSGNGVSGLNFNPAVAGVGTHLITYAVWDDPNGTRCPTVDTQSITVNPKPTITFTAPVPQLCVGSATVPLVGTGGGAFSGLKVTGTNFTPDSAGVFTIKYKATVGSCLDSILHTIAVLDTPKVTITNLAASYCTKSPAEVVALQAFPSGTGTFTKLTGPGTLTGSNFTITAPPGTATFSYTRTVAGCTGTAYASALIKATPDSNFTVAGAQPFPANDTSRYALNPVVSGGIFSGPGVLNVGGANPYRFVPASAGTVAPYPKKVGVKYQVTVNGCTSVKTDSISITDPITSGVLGLPSTVCRNDGTKYLLRGVPAGGEFDTFPWELYGLLDASVNQDGVVDSVYFTPKNIASSATIFIGYRPPSFPSFQYSPVQIKNKTTANIISLPTPFCTNNGVVTLTGSPDASGQFFYNTTLLTGNSLDMSITSPGPANLTYIYTNTDGCRDTVVKPIQVYEPTPLSFSALTDRCINGTAFSLNGSASPVGGSFFGKAVIGGTNYIPSQAGVGLDSVSYRYTNANGCTDTIKQYINIRALPIVSFAGGSPTEICGNESIVKFTGTPGGGLARSFSGPGIVSDSSFSPIAAGSGNKTITFSFTDNFGCSNSANHVIQVKAPPVANFTVPPAASYCINQPQEVIVGDGSPILYTKQYRSLKNPGSILNNGEFSPNFSGFTGIDTIYYIKSEPGSITCKDSTFRRVVINPLPVLSITNLNSAYCRVDADYVLKGNFSPAGRFFGPGISADSVFNAKNLPGGAYPISYTYTDANACTDTITQNTTVNNLPTININGVNSFYCPNVGAQSISALPSGGSFSGPGVSGGNMFNPDVAGYNANHTLTYQVTDGNGCTNSKDTVVSVPARPALNFSQIKNRYCKNEGVQPINANPEGVGTFSGVGVDNGSKSFNPGAVPGSSSTITYTVNYGPSNACSISRDSTVIVYNAPAASIIGLAPQYCKTGDTVTLAGNPVGGTFSSLTSDISFGGTNRFVLFNTLPAGPQTISYIYKDANNCSDTALSPTEINNLPTPAITGLASTGYCVNAAPVTMTGIPALGTGNAAYFKAKGLTGTNTFNPSLVGGEIIDTVTYVYTDNKNCTDSARVFVNVHRLPVITLDFITPSDSVLCTNGVPIQIAGGGDKQRKSSEFFADAGLLTVSSSFAQFNPAVAGQGYHRVVYRFEDNNSCLDSAERYIRVHPAPVAGFTISSFCAGDTITFNDTSSVNAPDAVDKWKWVFTNGMTAVSPNDFVQNFQGVFTPRAYTATLTATTNNNCSNTKTYNFDVGPYAIPNFTWKNICDGDMTQFTDLSIQPFGAIIDTWKWDFGTGNVGDTSLNQNPSFSYNITGSYPAKLTTFTDLNCKSEITKNVDILPGIDAYPYEQDFETSTSGWFADNINGTNSSWVRGVPTKKYINTGATGNNVWVTSLDTFYNVNEQSWVYSPCFDFTSLTRPMIRFDYMSMTDGDANGGRDGAVLQSSIDGGNTWVNIGDYDFQNKTNTGLSWYNSGFIIGAPGQNLVQNADGWSGRDTVWRTARHKLDDLKGEPSVRFRIAFGSDANHPPIGEWEGFAFDNVWIGERSKVVLMEHFSNGSNSASAENDPYMFNLISNAYPDAVGITYHTGFPGFDVFNSHNVEDPGARVLYYGVKDIPRSIMDGILNRSSRAISYIDVDKRNLTDPLFHVALDVDKQADKVSAKAVFTGLTPISGDISGHLAIVERAVKGVTAANNDTLFEWVLKKMLPDAAGKLLKFSWTPGTQDSLSGEWAYQQVYNDSMIGVVAYIQNDNTREVYQTAYVGPGFNSNIVVPPVGLDKGLQEHDVLLYPNPARDVAMLYFTANTGVPVSGTIMDGMGKTVMRFEVPIGTEYHEINLNPLASGMYYVKLTGKTGQTVKKLSVVK